MQVETDWFVVPALCAIHYTHARFFRRHAVERAFLFESHNHLLVPAHSTTEQQVVVVFLAVTYTRVRARVRVCVCVWWVRAQVHVYISVSIYRRQTHMIVRKLEAAETAATSPQSELLLLLLLLLLLAHGSLLGGYI